MASALEAGAMALDVAKILDGLRYLREADRDLSVFGANGHRYTLRPRQDEAAVDEFERRHSIRLPDDYRQFLLEVGNGGAGPCYGIHGLDQLFEASSEGSHHLSKPFPYRLRWEGPQDLLDAIRGIEDGDADDWENTDKRGELIDSYWEFVSWDGSLSICEYGCNLRFLLIVNGPEFGRIWFDATADVTGFSPVAINATSSSDPLADWCVINQDVPEAERVGFAEWYEAWLDWACSIVSH
jgi:hypothetical protein